MFFTINRYRVGKRNFADLFAAIECATVFKKNVIDSTTGLIVWRNPAI